MKVSILQKELGNLNKVAKKLAIKDISKTTKVIPFNRVINSEEEGYFGKYPAEINFQVK